MKKGHHKLSKNEPEKKGGLEPPYKLCIYNPVKTSIRSNTCQTSICCKISMCLAIAVNYFCKNAPA